MAVFPGLSDIGGQERGSEKEQYAALNRRGEDNFIFSSKSFTRFRIYVCLVWITTDRVWKQRKGMR